MFSGVPQGSVIGPLLFNLYINDIMHPSLPLNKAEGGIRLFADDAKLFSTDIEKLQATVNEVGHWLENRQLKLAPHKCFSLAVSKNKADISKSISINDTKLSTTTFIKDLGVYISHDLKWTHHVNYIYRNASVCSYQLYKSVKTRNIWIWVKLFKTYVRPKLEYATSVWSPDLKKDIKKIESVQKVFTKRACNRCGMPFTSYYDRLVKLNLKSLQYRRIFFDL